MNLQKIQQASVFVAGDIMLDRYWFGQVERISPEAPVPVLKVDHTEDRLGGAANVARNIVSLGAQAALMGVIGDDEAGNIVEHLLNKDHIKSHCIRDPLIPTIIKLRAIGRQQQLLRIDFEKTPDSTLISNQLNLYKNLLEGYDTLVLSDYGKGGLARVSDMIGAAKALGKNVLVDPKGDDYSRYHHASILTPNRAELRQVIGKWGNEEDLTNKAQNLRTSLNLDALLLTRSEEGMTLYQNNQVNHFPAQAREVFDVSGAGDTVIATLAVMLDAGMPIVEAVAMANQAGGIVVGKLGTATVTAEELFN